MWYVAGAVALALMLGVFVGMAGSNARTKAVRKRLKHLERLQETFFKGK